MEFTNDIKTPLMQASLHPNHPNRTQIGLGGNVRRFTKMINPNKTIAKLEVMMLDTPCPSHIELYEPDGNSDRINIITNYDDTRELFVYEIPRGLEIIGLECVRFDRDPGDKSNRSPTISQFSFLLWRPLDHIAPYHQIKTDEMKPKREVVDSYDSKYYKS